jgi:hypothetical protein
MRYLVHHDAEGRITATVNDPVPPEYLEMCDERGLAYVLCEGDVAPVTIYDDTMVRNGKLARRPSCPARIQIEGRRVTMSKVPRGSRCLVEIEGTEMPLEEKSVEVDEPGPLRIVIRPPWPYREISHDLEIE